VAANKTPKFNASGNQGMNGRMALAFKRAEAIGFDWCGVDQVELLSALTTALQAGAAVMFSQASGGKGVCVKVFQGEGKAIDYAGLPEELDNLLGQITDAYSSTSEDAREVIRQRLKHQA